MLSYDMPLYRPPSEGQNLIIQATLGCHFNQCSFCSMYKSKNYQARPIKDVFNDIEQAALNWPDTNRVFLADGDALTLPTEHILTLLNKLTDAFPRLSRVTCYANPSDILRKPPEELATLKANGLTMVYMGIESGSSTILKKITKGASPRSIERALVKIEQSGIKVSATVILGLGGQSYWQEHIDETAKLLSKAPVNYLSTLQLYLEEDAWEDFHKKFAEPFQWQDDAAILLEQKRLISSLAPPHPIIFRSNHASNALALAGTLPKDQAKLIAHLDRALDGESLIRHPSLRRL